MDVNHQPDCTSEKSGFAAQSFPYYDTQGKVMATRRQIPMSYSDNITPNILLTPVKELEEEITIETDSESKLNEKQSQYTNSQYLRNGSAKPTANKSSSFNHKCSVPNCKVCCNGFILTDGLKQQVFSKHNSNGVESIVSGIVESQTTAKSDTKEKCPSKAESKPANLIFQKSKSKLTTKKSVPMGSAGSALQKKKYAKTGKTRDGPKNSKVRVESRVQKGVEYEAKTAKTLQRLDTKYKSIGSKNSSSSQKQNTPFIEDVYPSKEDNGKKLLQKVKVTTSNVPYHFRVRSAPHKKRANVKLPEAPKSSRTKKNVTNMKEIPGSECTSQNSSNKKEIDQNAKEKEDIKKPEITDGGSSELSILKEGDLAESGAPSLSDARTLNLSTSDNINSESGLDSSEDVKSNHDEDGGNGRRALRKVNTAPSMLYSQIQQAAIDEGVEEIVLVDFPTNHDTGDHGLHHYTEEPKTDQSDNSNDLRMWNSDSTVLNPSSSNLSLMLDGDGNMNKLQTEAEHGLKIDIPSASDSDADHSRSPNLEKNYFDGKHSSNWLTNQRHEASLTSGSSLGRSFREMFDMRFDKDNENDKMTALKGHPDFCDKDALTESGDVDSMMEDGDATSDNQISSSFVIKGGEKTIVLPNLIEQLSVKNATERRQKDVSWKTIDSMGNSSHSADDSINSKKSITILPMLTTVSKTNKLSTTLSNRPASSRAWCRKESSEWEDLENSEDSLEINEEDFVPFNKRYQSLTVEEVSPENEEVISNRPVTQDYELADETESTIQTILTEQALKEHNFWYNNNKHLDVAKNTELHYSEEDRANMQSRLSSVTATTDFSIVTDSTFTGDIDTSEFKGWKKGRELGHGAYGTVFEGLTVDGKLIAVKQVELTVANRDIANKEFKRVRCEVELLKTVRHKNIVRLLGTCFEGVCVHIFMENVPGGSIKSILTQYGALQERIFRKYTKQILEGLSYLHGIGIVHRDIKGSNVMLMTNGTIKLIDFGCAKRLRESALLRESTGSREATLLKTMLGTPYWMAPEVITSQGHGPRSDIWSVGATVYEMATTQPPLKNLEATAAMFHIGNGNEMPELPRPQFSRSAIQFVKKCFIRDQYMRPKASELLNHRFITHKK